jgi:hypothetical protein
MRVAALAAFVDSTPRSTLVSSTGGLRLGALNDYAMVPFDIERLVVKLRKRLALRDANDRRLR